MPDALALGQRVGNPSRIRRVSRSTTQYRHLTDVLEAANGKTVRIPGFMVPLEDFLDRVSEFLLVPYMGACIHVPPPPPNQLVYVQMAEDRDVKMAWWEPIWLEGRLQVETVNSVYGAVGFQLEGVEVEPYED